MAERILKLVIEYDGTDFHGWQRQREQRTVQGVLQAALCEVLGEENVTVEGAGRTDAGVHARGQVASFACPSRLPASALPPLLNRRLPADTRVRSAAEVPPGFSARRTATGRRYAYRLLQHPDVLRERFAWHPRRAFDLDRLSRATRALEGEHDCSAFRTSGSGPTRPECRISRATWSVEDGAARLDIVADHFLYRMVRNIVGTALKVSASPDPGGAMAAILASRDRQRAGLAAPPQGLCLEEVFYPAEEPPSEERGA